MFVYQPMKNLCRYRTNIFNKLPVRLIFIFSLNVIYENINGIFAPNSRLPTRVAGRNETDESAVEPLGTLSRSNTITSTPLSFAARAATRPAAPAPTIAMLTLWSHLLVFSNRTLLKLGAPKFLSRCKFRLPEL